MRRMTILSTESKEKILMFQVSISPKYENVYLAEFSTNNIFLAIIRNTNIIMITYQHIIKISLTSLHGFSFY